MDEERMDKIIDKLAGEKLIWANGAKYQN
jgi:hypothetical protein